MKISYPKNKGHGNQRGESHSENKKCRKFDEKFGKLKISFSKCPHKFEIFGGLSHFWLQRSSCAVYVSVELAQPNTLKPNTLQDYSIVNRVINIAYTLHFFSNMNLENNIFNFPQVSANFPNFSFLDDLDITHDL